MHYQSARTHVRQAVLTAAYNKGAAFGFDDIRELVPPDISDLFIANQAELLGFSVWTSVPDSVFRAATGRK
jgi:hypothetical protein